MSSRWIDFWDSKHPIYVSARHEAAHFRRIAEDIRKYAPPGGVMLDYGCGEALSADLVAEPLSQLILCEAAPNVRLMVAARFAGNSKIVVRTTDDVPHMTAVVQYLTHEEFAALLKTLRRVLKPGGLLVIGDVIPKQTSALADAKALLRFGKQEGFYGAALRGLVRAYFSEYWRLRKSLGLTRYDGADMTARLEAAGFTAELAPSNIGHNDRRMTFLAHTR
jgi:SAM-dependent methyltransferase